MYEFADVVWTTRPIQGTSLEAEGVPQKFCPVSGVTSTAILSLVAATVKPCWARITAGLLAANVDGSEEYNARMLRQQASHLLACSPGEA
jgi:uncharacterized phosphosugar-binding protein